MGIWNYQEQTQSIPLLESIFATRACPCCRGSPRLEPADVSRTSDGRQYSEYIEVLVCSVCGWWFAFQDSWDSSCGSVPDRALRSVTASGAALSSFSDVPDPAQILALEREIRKHIHGHGNSDSWAVLEDTTTAIFKSFGFEARATAQSKDGGIDVVVDHPNLGAVYAQVKHTKNKVGVRVLRELIGTMCINGNTNSLLVTSSCFTNGVFREQQLAAQRGFIVELVDGARLLSSLRLTHRLTLPTISDVLSVARPTAQVFWGNTVILLSLTHQFTDPARKPRTRVNSASPTEINLSCISDRVLLGQEFSQRLRASHRL